MSAASPRAVVAACWKLVELRASVDPLDGSVTADPVSAAASPADEAALELALRAAERWGASVAVVSASGDLRAEAMLRGALACGATRAILVHPAIGGTGHARRRPEGDTGTLEAPSEAVASLLACALRRLGAPLLAVFCGDASVDRGSGSVPAFLAAELAAAQLLGVLGVRFGDSPGELEAERRLERGRRELARTLRASGMGAVVSVEAGAARLRRSSLEGVLQARRAPVEAMVADASATMTSRVEVREVGPWRPRTHVVAGPPASLPARERILRLNGTLDERTPARLLRLDPGRAADALLAQLREWDELA